jgi:uncharacterized damage-inducible protein DinB
MPYLIMDLLFCFIFALLYYLIKIKKEIKVMTIAQVLLEELKQEAASTKKLLERVPLEKGDWKPHEKSMAMNRLASHVAENFEWVGDTINSDEIDFAKHPYEPFIPKNTKELIKYFDECYAKAEKALSKCSDEEMMKNWTMRNGEQVYFTMPKSVVIRSFCINHMIHHRGQLTVYMRLLDVPLPGIYGPTADESASK